jgi:hypothetical protein
MIDLVVDAARNGGSIGELESSAMIGINPAPYRLRKTPGHD